MQNHTDYMNNDPQPLRMTSALRDGLITLSGLAVATGGFFYEEIAMWWSGI